MVIRSKLVPPRLQRYTLARPRLMTRLQAAGDYRLTLIQAGTGYGKTTALASFAAASPCVWYRLDAADGDPYRFLLHLLDGFRAVCPRLPETAAVLLEEWGWNRSGSWTAITDTLLNALNAQAELFLILDDAHHLQETAETLRILDRLIGLAPPNLHLILATRYPISLPSLITWRVKGQVLEIGQTELAFTSAEIDALFRNCYGYNLTLEQASLLVSSIEGWPIALYLIWQRLQKDGGATIAEALAQLSGSASDLFAYLTQEVLAQQAGDVQAFLQLTSLLRQMTVESCNIIREASDSEQILRYLLEKGLFVVDLGEGVVRYHHLFRDLLRQQVPAGSAQSVHKRAALYYQQQQMEEEALYHLLAGEAFGEAADLLDGLGREMVRIGRLDTLANWIGTLPLDILIAHPALLAYLGDVARLHSHFDQALGWYQQAEQCSRNMGDLVRLGQALRGQARVYLDTVNPSQAEMLLQEALRLSDGQESRESRARLLDLLAENWLNQGRVAEARAYQAQARELRQEGPSEVELPVRMLLRTGRLREARSILEKQGDLERQEPVLRPRAHRETLLLLSLVLAFQGEQEAAQTTAVAGTKRGELLQSEFVTAVGLMRQGHAWSLFKNLRGYENAARCYQQAISYSEELEVPRLKVEAYWGLCQVHGFQGDLAAAEQAAQQGIAIAQTAGDEWIEGNIRLVLGASYVLTGKVREATAWLMQATASSLDCADTYAQAGCYLWQCLVWQQIDDTARLARDVTTCLQLCHKHGYDYLFTHKTLPGPLDPRSLVPLLIFARDHDHEAVYANALLVQMGLANIELHPGYQLRVQTLGQFRVERGQQEVAAGDWKRAKARELFQLLLTFYGRSLHREQIIEMLWPESEPEAALRDFKIAYSTVCSVLEPERKRNAPSAFIYRDESHYGLRPEADIWLDVAAFRHGVQLGDEAMGETAVSHYRQALSLFAGEYLPASPYAEWCRQEREQLHLLYLQTAEKFATISLEQADYNTTIHLCQTILAQDNCWEPAYRLLMKASVCSGNRSQAIRAYEQCVHALKTELGVEPDSETTAVYRQIVTPKDYHQRESR